VALRTPKGIVVAVAPLFCRRTDTGAECAIEKDGGDDVDVTTGLPVIATVELLPGCTDIRIDGGRGVGRVTKTRPRPTRWCRRHQPCAPADDRRGPAPGG